MTIIKKIYHRIKFLRRLTSITWKFYHHTHLLQVFVRTILYFFPVRIAVDPFYKKHREWNCPILLLNSIQNFHIHHTETLPPKSLTSTSSLSTWYYERHNVIPYSPLPLLFTFNKFTVLHKTISKLTITENIKQIVWCESTLSVFPTFSILVN